MKEALKKQANGTKTSSFGEKDFDTKFLPFSPLWVIC